MDQDRPLSSLSEDAFGRKKFVERLCRTLVTYETKPPLATGMVVGLAGEWGSGKSTILNFVEETLQIDFHPIAIVRFNPWLVSGRDDLIRNFFEELAREIKKNAPTQKDKIDDLLGKIRKYRALADIGADYLPIPEELRGRLKAIAKILFQGTQSDVGLNELKKQINSRVRELELPLVVLIDEVDRVDDEEIKILAQLVKSVADFPNVSYLIAYDTTRVLQALGAAAPDSERTERGRNYLEKIIQLQVPVPVIFGTELTDNIRNDLKSMSDTLSLPERVEATKRYIKLEQILFEGLIRTARDLKRLLGAFGTMRSMTGTEVNWVDVLGFSALLCKAPDIAALVQADPLFFTDDFRGSLRWSRERIGMEQEDIIELDKRVLGNSWATQNYASLLVFLFGRFANDGALKAILSGPDDADPTRISRYRSLSILVRNGMPPGTWSMDEIHDLVSTVASGQLSPFEDAIFSERADDLLVMLRMRGDVFKSDHLLHFWAHIGRWVAKPDSEIPETLDPRWYFIHRLSDAFDDMVAVNVGLQNLFGDLLSQLQRIGGSEFLAAILRGQVHAHGLFKHARQPRHEPTTDPRLVEEWCAQVGKEFKKAHQRRDWIFLNWTMAPIYLLMDCGMWDEPERKRLREITEQAGAFRALNMMMFSGNHIVDAGGLKEVFGWPEYGKRVQREINSRDENNWSRDVLSSLDRAADHLPVTDEQDK